MVEPEHVAGDAQAELVGRAPPVDRRLTGDGDGDQLRAHGDGEEGGGQAGDLARVGALRGAVDDRPHDHGPGEGQGRPHTEQAPEREPAPAVGPEQGQEGAPARGAAVGHRASLPPDPPGAVGGLSVRSPIGPTAAGADTLPGMEPTTDVLAADEATELDEALVEEELLVEEISIDGMCGVY